MSPDEKNQGAKEAGLYLRRDGREKDLGAYASYSGLMRL